ncbi:MAG: hypothetical protein M3O86_05730 [Actinomycetota bacterium]|nr:hypothetical protein [Actinomycetota bacterium]
MGVMDEVARLDRFFVQQKFRPAVNVYRISTVADGGGPGRPLVHVRQRRMKIRERIDFYADEAQREPVLRLQARKVFEFRGRSDVVLPSGEVIGSLQKVFGASLLRSSWRLLDGAGAVVATAQESSLAMAVLRRVWGFLPLVNNVPFFLPFHFDIAVDDRTVGRYRRLWALRDRYELDLSGDVERRIDRRVALAFTIALDALQDR